MYQGTLKGKILRLLMCFALFGAPLCWLLGILGLFGKSSADIGIGWALMIMVFFGVIPYWFLEDWD
jgi:hypothetical protein